MHALEELQAVFETELLFVESGGDNLAGEWEVLVSEKVDGGCCGACTKDLGGYGMLQGADDVLDCL